MTATPENTLAAAPARGVITPSDVSPVARDRVESDDLAAMRARFVADFSGGLMGQHHNTYQHRARVLRQQTDASRRAAGEPRR
ncbi:hypothetical protein RCO27_10940 [Sphingosinicella sp. LHD-64]|uniref:hypothetical protein n=1 Tax=Sphingosinicella sp. LHD-64 TaxID=3072139 RepID=UPI00280F4A92|nr:hypothetical protein [Sphingosinicella sp. LHD-64]MDQ8756744.1 hypothetical protein [Sphingosinicella sp. LHD-64]